MHNLPVYDVLVIVGELHTRNYSVIQSFNHCLFTTSLKERNPINALKLMLRLISGGPDSSDIRYIYFECKTVIFISLNLVSVHFCNYTCPAV